MMESLGGNIDAETGNALSNGFVLLKEDIDEALELLPAGTATVEVLRSFNLRAKGAS